MLGACACSLFLKEGGGGDEARGSPRRLLCACACSLNKNKKKYTQGGDEVRGHPGALLCRSAQKLQFSGVRCVELQPGC